MEKAEKEKAKQTRKEIKERIKSSENAINRTAEQIAEIEKIKNRASDRLEKILAKIGGLNAPYRTEKIGKDNFQISYTFLLINNVSPIAITTLNRHLCP